MTNELWPVGTWVADISKDGCCKQAYFVGACDGGDMGLCRFVEKVVSLWSCSKDEFTELPPLPGVEALKNQGYRLTGMAADMSDPANKGKQFASVSGISDVIDVSQQYNGWRWLVEKIA